MSYMKHRTMKWTTWMRLLLMVVILNVQCSMFNVYSQILIGGNVYGGGNAGDMTGNTSVTVRAGDIHGGVYGGARQANVGGHAFVNIDGKHMSDNIVINYVYGGNDIAGKVGESITTTDDIPAELLVKDNPSDNPLVVVNGITPAEGEANAGKNTKQYSAFVLTTNERTVTTVTGETATTTQPYHIFIGQLFGGGNGDYTYSTTTNADGNYTASDANGPIAYSKMALVKPELGKTYLELRGGTIAYAYGGGNNATVTKATDICVKNSSSVTTDEHLKTILSTNDAGIKDRMKEMGLNTVSTQVSSDDFQFARVFGGNNKAEMSIRPTWHLESGAIRNLYSGGNQGAMTHKEGLLLEILANSSIKVDNVFGGCRMAAVRPLVSGTLASGNYVESSSSEIQLHDANGVKLYNFPDGLSARVLVRGGDINNVYGGNDISGNVTGGNAIGIYASVRGDVYGGGNGSYAYTDNADLATDEEYKDFYYSVPDGKTSVEALNAFRPNAQAVSIRVLGKKDETTGKITNTIIGGAIYCGGNSATLRNDNPNQDAASELMIGSYVIADKVFLGNNGANMVTEDVLKQLKASVPGSSDPFSTIDLTQSTQMETYMDGVAMEIKPRVVFDADYVPYSTMFGSFYCGGNVGSMKVNGALEISFNDKVVIYDKVVGGSNEANVYEKYDASTQLNAQYLGGLLGAPGTNGNKLILNFGGLKIQPKRWMIKRKADYTPDLDSDGNEQYVLDDDGNRQLEWNTVDSREYNTTTKKYTPMPYIAKGGSTTYDADNDPYRRFYGGNIYGGCYSNGHVNGNVVINLNASLVDRKGENSIFDEVEENEGEAKLYDGNYNIKYRYTGVLVGEQGMDPLGRALNVFGGGYGGDSEIWGSATINLNAGYTFQIFGGGEQGAIGKAQSHEPDPNDPTKHNLEYEYNADYSTYINLSDQNKHPGTYRGDTDNRVDGIVDYDDMAEAEFIYGGSFEGLIAGNTHINLGNGRIFNTFAGSCNADILGHTETYVGRNSNDDNDLGFPWIRDHIYGGNDLGGRILANGGSDGNDCNFTNRVSEDIKDKVYNPKVLKASAYTEYIQGRVEYIFGGCYGDYDYRDPHYKNYAYTTDSSDKTEENLGTMRSDYHKPWMDNAFVNFKPTNIERNAVTRIYGAGQGHAYYHASDAERDMMQDRSYILIDAPQSLTNFTGMEVFGAGDYSGVGMRNEAATTRTSGETEEVIVPALNPEIAKENTDGVTASTVIDLMRGHLKAVYGGSFKEGTTRRTQVNVPAGSTIHATSLFGGAYGRIDKETVNSVTTEIPRIDLACDVYEAIVNYSSNDATIDYAIYGGNNACRRTLYGKVNINSPVWSNKSNGYTATVYGAGCGVNTWSQYTEVNLNNGASVYEVYGGGEDGQVLNSASVVKWKETQTNLFTTLSKGYTDNGLADGTPANSNKLFTVDNTRPKYYNTNVHINQGATVGGYCYGGGLGHGNIKYSGNVYGTTYIDLLGGKVEKDLYAAGTTGSVKDSLGVKGDFVASATAYIEGGSARNVYGGGWKGSVGHHDGGIDADYYDTTTKELIDIPGETYVVIGMLKDKLETAPEGDSHYHLYHGIPYVERNAYGGGEGGAVWGTTHITLNNGYIGYIYNQNGTDNAKTVNIDERYEEKIEDDTYKDEDGHFQENKRLDDAGCIFGGGYIDNSSVDFTHVTMYGGHVRNALFGGGEIAAIGRGKITETIVDGKAVRSLQDIYRPGKTEIEMFDGYVHRNVFGGGRGYNNLGDHGKFFSDGYVFGQTLVHIHGGEIGTQKELLAGNGNVFGGGDIGYVYSAYEYTDDQGRKLPRKGVKSGVRYDGDGMYQGYYYEHVWENTSSNESSFIHYNGTERKLTEDCKVLIAPHCKVTDADGITLTIKYIEGQVVSAHDLMYISSHPELGLSGKIDPFGKVTAEDGISFSRHYAKGEYVQTSALHAFGNKEDDWWKKLEANTNDDGIIIHNAVFAGGNTSSKGSDDESTFANSVSVYGNVTASIHDVYHRDLITIGTGHIGGLYGDGNLTLVDGYRGLNITNYGTDYNYLYDEKNKKELSINEYNALLDREKDYYELRYKCIKECTDDDGTVYHPKDDNHSNASTLTADDILTMFAKQNGENGTVNMFATDDDGNKIPNPTYWEQNGVCSIYAGRILNTLQRADFCGVFGSRLVMQGAQDRVPEVVDYTKYTINRVREVSLNKKLSVIPADAENDKRKMHGNYFGIYSVVNFLGALTSDFDFGDQGNDSDEHDAAGKYTDNNGKDQPYTGDVGKGDVRNSDNINTGTYGPQYTGQTFYGWKRFHKNDRDRNNGNSHNKVALASGVYLELTTEESTGKDLYEKVWGPITGVVELDLINVQQGMGGGFVYAKNIHGVRTKTNRTNTTLTALNAGAVTRWDYTYEEPSTTSNAADPKQREWQTSGNFVHSTQTIIDDCYNVSNKYMGSDRVPAHYWYIKGSVYVYDQYISAYTGATNAYSEMVDIPLTITAASHGTMKLLNVQPNRYAYYNTNMSKLTGEQKLVINDVEYTLNTPISYWDWYKLTAAEQKLFVPKTYVSVAKYKYSQNAADEFPAEQVLLPEDYTAIVNHAHKKVDENNNYVLDDEDNYILELWDVENEKYVPVESVIRMSNNLSHDTGYILTYKVNNPTEWNSWYTEYFDTSNTSAVREKKQDKTQLQTETDPTSHSQKGPNEGPTYRLKSGTGEWLGQRRYKVSEIISDDVVTTYNQAIATSPITDTETQATFVRAYVATAQTDIQRNGQTTHLYKGSTLSATEAAGVSNVAEALVCTKTIRLSSTDNLYINSVMTAAEKSGHLNTVKAEISTLVTEINTVLAESSITPIATDISEISSLTVAQLNKITALQKKELSDLLTRKKDITNNIVPAYYCTKAGLYGGDYYASGINYRGLEAWSSMSEEDRAKFDFNYDALDLLIDPNFSKAEGVKYQYDSEAGDEDGARANPAGYSLEKPVDYTATYTGEDITLPTGVTVTTLNSTTPKSTLTSGDELSRTVYESLPNEQRHYTPLTVTPADVDNNKTCTFYVVNTPMMIGSTPYTIGNLISKNDYDGLYSTDPNLNQQGKVTILNYTESGTHYFCREAYGNVAVGTVISSTDYEALTNLQKGFIIHGIAPTETSTLYVSRFSDINDLSTEKIITVIYEYDYEESDVSGMHITPVTERHVLNIHLQFKTGAPIVEDISTPPIVLPGDILSLVPPNVIEGASPIQGGGWELYSTENDADNHNGVGYIPDIDPLYWYQNGYWLRYYALSYVGGKTYSNKVQVSVANYHDLKKVMEDKAHHYFVDIPDLNRLRESKIYINDAENGAQQLKDLFDLSLLTTAPTSGTLSGHSTLDPQVRGCDNLEFIMRTNVNHTGTWTSIGGGTAPCFEGVLHGDGHYISGLSESLFGKLCGEVYNLGVTGSFTGAGIAETGEGYVENCWISTNSEAAKTSQPIFGNPNRTSGRLVQVVNSYYKEDYNDAYVKNGDVVVAKDGSYTKQIVDYNDSDHGTPVRKDEQAFYNGEVAYDLNGFYLYKRYRDHSGLTSTDSYKYFTIEDLAKTTPTPSEASYGTSDTDTKLSSSGAGIWNKGYVEDRYADGDFRYAGGEIPETNDERLYIDTEDNGRTKFCPIWPDDYLFFGQMLTYGWNESSPHEEVPSPIVKNSGRLLDTYRNNRVYRAPAYFRNKEKSVVHFNPQAYLAAYSAPKTVTDTNLSPAYPNLTAVDFAGHNDIGGSDSYKLGWNSSLFYEPLLDDDGLIGVSNNGETPNLLVYAPAEEAENGYANKDTYDVLNDYFIGTTTNRTEPVYINYTESSSNYNDNKTYGRIALASTDAIHGHLVQSNLTTITDHLLVDKRDFNCPIDYTMGEDYRMWYQRTPDNYVTASWSNDATPKRTTKGWEGVSLPFEAEIVATQNKGELTHFYQGSTAGHEYWLREFKGGAVSTANSSVFEATFNPLAAGSNEKNYTNTFLWDYYYSHDDNTNQSADHDKNEDEYQKTYYNNSHLYSDYPYSQGGTPYIIGFPGVTYYEFDLSGNWTPKHRYRDVSIASPGKQTVTFASVEGAHIGVSDYETVKTQEGKEAGVTVNGCGYTFKPSYLNDPELESSKHAFLLNSDGNSYVEDKTNTTVAKVTAFRPYFTAAPGGGSARSVTRSIIFSNDNSEIKGVVERGDPKEETAGTLNIYAKEHKIIVESALNYTTDVRIVNLAGMTINAFTIEPGETIETRINTSGVYIVQPSEARFIKKLSVR